MPTTPKDKKIAALQAEIEALSTSLRSEREKYKIAQRMLDEATGQLENKSYGDAPKGPYKFGGLSIIIAYYNIPKQIERTLISCSENYQNAPGNEIEVIIADNGSTEPLPEGLKKRFPVISKILRTDGQPSPVFALNAAIKHAKYDTIAMMIDGAHILSPGVFKNTKEVCQLNAQPVINVPQYYLGSISQNLNPKRNAWDRETWRLEKMDWPKKGYSLFNYALFPSENIQRTHHGAIETNCLIAKKSTWEKLGGFDERFDEPGAGYANLEIFSRFINAMDTNYVVFPGEGSFHQDHSGTTTNKSPAERDEIVKKFRERYTEVTGLESLINLKSPSYYGLWRRSAIKIPTISKDYGLIKNKILVQLANIYVGRAEAGIQNDFHPKLVAGGLTDEREARPPLKPVGQLDRIAESYGVEPTEMNYLKFLRRLHEVRKPELYFEIGVDKGISMALSNCRSIGVDPAFAITTPWPPRTRLYKEKSDGFFKQKKRTDRLLKDGIDLAFIDGMHLAEFVVRDFINVEKYCKPGGVIMFDDVLPEQMEMAERDRRFNAWTGDVYKIAPILRQYRPDLEVGVFYTFIGPYRKGLAVVKNLDPKNTVLEKNYKQIEKDIFGDAYAINSIEHLDEMMQISSYKDFETFIAP